MHEPCRWVTLHWLRFPEVHTLDALDLTARPAGAAGWKIGSDGAAAADGSRVSTEVWCAVEVIALAATRPARCSSRTATTRAVRWS